MIRLYWSGRMANKLIQYLFALIIHNETGCGIQCDDLHKDTNSETFIPGFPNIKNYESKLETFSSNQELFVYGQKPLVNEVGKQETQKYVVSYLKLFDLARNHNLKIQGYFQRMDFLSQFLELARHVCKSNISIHPQIEQIVDYDNDLVIHLRYGDYHMNDRADKISWTHKPLDVDEVVSIYNKIKNEVIVKQVWLVCENHNDVFVRDIAALIPNNLIVSVNPTHDFVFISKFKHVFMSPSTFSFMAAWTSMKTEKAYFPLVGAFHPKSHKLPNVDSSEHRWFFYINDSRFTYIDLSLPSHPFLTYEELGVDEIL